MKSEPDIPGKLLAFVRAASKVADDLYMRSEPVSRQVGVAVAREQMPDAGPDGLPAPACLAAEVRRDAGSRFELLSWDTEGVQTGHATFSLSELLAACELVTSDLTIN